MTTEMHETVRTLSVGDIVPSFTLRNTDGQPYDIAGDEVAGRFRVLLFCGTSAAGAEAYGALVKRAGELKKFDARLLAVAEVAGGAADAAVAQLVDPGGRVATLLRPEGAEPQAPFLAVLCPNQHLLGVFTTPRAQFDSAIALIGREARHFRAAEGGRHAPILQVPQVLSAEDCKRLIAIFNTEGNVFIEPGHGDKAMTQDYKMRIPEYGRHDRIDHWVLNEATVRFINERLKRRLLPEVRKAFAYAITRHEPYRITKYEGERGGEQHGHRDNSELRVAHRRFALSINLNSEQFDGGGLRFPEFGGQVYRPPSGTALLFSSGLLHEAMHVTKGRRFVLLGFMFGES